MGLTSAAAAVTLVKDYMVMNYVNGAAILLLLVGLVYWIETLREYLDTKNLN